MLMRKRTRWHSRQTKPRSRRKFFFIAMVIFTLFSLQSFIYIEKNMRPPLMALAKMRIKQIATTAINKAISEQVARGSDYERLIDWKTDSQGKVAGFMLNYAENIKITSNTKDIVEGTLAQLKEMPEHIPLGQAMGSAIIGSFGPRVPVKLEPQGAVKVALNTRQQDAGINMILVEVYIRIVAEVAIIIPFDTEPELVETEIPISYLLVVGDVPMYYYDNKGNPVGERSGNAPSIALPMPSAPAMGDNPEGTTTTTTTTPTPQEQKEQVGTP
ncbi:Sporulation protein YunB [Paenibacillus sp. CECT 9249]|nr:Sporulation protein YunB [Paenibacillus sp. CECT 9249]